MPINVAYQPSFGLVGQLAYLSGAGARSDDLYQQGAQFALQDLLQRRSLANQQAQQNRAIAAQQQMAMFDRAGDMDRMRAAAAQAQAGRAFDWMQTQAQIAARQRHDEMMLDKDFLHQQWMGDRQQSLADQEYAFRREQEARAAQQAQQLRELDFRSRLDTAEYEHQLGFEEQFAGLQLNTEGQSKRDSLYKQLEIIKKDNERMRPGTLGAALTLWRKDAHELFSPQFSAKQPTAQDRFSERSFPLTDKTVLVELPDGKYQEIQKSDPGVRRDPISGRMMIYDHTGVPEPLIPSPTFSEIQKRVDELAKSYSVGGDPTVEQRDRARQVVLQDLQWFEKQFAGLGGAGGAEGEGGVDLAFAALEGIGVGIHSPKTPLLRLLQEPDPSKRRQAFETNTSQFMRTSGDDLFQVLLQPQPYTQEQVSTLKFHLRHDIDILTRLYGSVDLMPPHVKQHYKLLKQVALTLGPQIQG